MGTGKINYDYIGYIKENDGVLEYAEEPIENHSIDFYRCISEVVKSEDSTVHDLWKATKIYADNNSISFWPKGYCFRSDNYCDVVYGAVKVLSPEIILEMETKKRECRKEYEDSKKNKQGGGAFNYKEHNEILKKAIAVIKNEYKARFYDNLLSTIWIINYEHTLTKIKKEQHDAFLFSHDYKGWSNVNYLNITNDIDINIKTNFCYGRDSYFAICIRYKGVDLLPYSKLILYRRAHIVDILRGTILLKPDRHEWDNAFKFVIDLCNEAKEDSCSFISKYVVEEIEKMLDGLAKINEDANCTYKRLGDTDYANWTLHWYNEQTTVLENDPKATEEEIIEFFRYEKITFSLDFVNSLSQLKEVSEGVQKEFFKDVIARIAEYNNRVLPQIQKSQNKIEGELEKLSERIETVARELEEAYTTFQPYEEAYKNYVRSSKNNKNDASDYLIRMPDYKRFEEQYRNKKQQLSELKGYLCRRNVTCNLLKQYIEKIMSAILDE